MTVSKVENKEPKEPKKGKGGRPPGHPKTGGRVKGTPNRNSLKFIENFDLCGINLVAEFMACVKKLEPRAQIEELKFLFKHAYPQLKEVEIAISSPSDNPARGLSTEELLARKS
jgi:hypothetical protein